MQCLGRTRTLLRCKNQTSFLVCNTHRIQPIYWAASLLGFIGLLAGLYQDAWKPLLGASPSANEEKLEIAERYVALIELGHGLFTLGIVSATNSSAGAADLDLLAREVEFLYSKAGVREVSAKSGPEAFKVIRDSISDERGRRFLDVGTLLAAGTLYGSAIVLHENTLYSSQGEQNLAELIPKLEDALLTLGLLSELGEYSKLHNVLYPSTDDTATTYELKQVRLKSAIVGSTRRLF